MLKIIFLKALSCIPNLRKPLTQKNCDHKKLSKQYQTSANITIPKGVLQALQSRHVGTGTRPIFNSTTGLPVSSSPVSKLLSFCVENSPSLFPNFIHFALLLNAVSLIILKCWAPFNFVFCRPKGSSSALSHRFGY